MTIYLDKTQVYTKQADEKAVLYNFITNILLNRIYAGRLIDVDVPIQMIASRRETNRLLNESFRHYLEQQVKQNHHGNLTVSIHSPSEEKGLQVVDFASWAIFRNYERGDDTYYRLIKKNVIEERAVYD